MKYRKRPVIIEAFQMTRARRINTSDWPQWLHEAWQKDDEELGAVSCVDFPQLEITTLEGRMLVNWGDYIIQGVKGELYPCKPDIFELTYEPVTD